MRKYAQKRQFVQSKKIPRGKVPKLRRLQFQTVCVSSNCLVSKSSPTPLRTQGLQPARLLCPWDFPGKNTGVGCHFLLQGIFLTQGSNPGLLHCRQILSHLSLQEGSFLRCCQNLLQSPSFTRSLYLPFPLLC